MKKCSEMSKTSIEFESYTLQKTTSLSFFMSPSHDISCMSVRDTTNWRGLFLCEYWRWFLMQQSRIYKYMRRAFFALCIMKSNGSGLGFTVQIYGMLIFSFLCCCLCCKPSSNLFIYLKCYLVNVSLQSQSSNQLSKGPVDNFTKIATDIFLLLHEWFVTCSCYTLLVV